MIPVAFFVFSVQLLGPEVGKGIDSPHVIGDISVSEMVKRPRESFDLSFDHQILMHKLPFPTGLVIPEEADFAVGIPNRVADPTAEVKNLAGHRKTGTLRLLAFKTCDLVS